MRAFKQSILKISVAILFSLLTACGGGKSSSSDSPTAKESAIEKITAYSQDGSRSAPTLQDYEDAGVSGVTNENLAELNTIVAGLEPSDVDTTSELEALTSSLGVNILPIANAGGNKVVQVNNSVLITGSGNDTDGSIVSYKWEKNGSVISTNATFNYTPISVGTNSLTLTVTDNDGGTASETIIITATVEPPPLNQAPIASAGVDKTVQVNTSITIVGTGSDVDGTISFVWKRDSIVLSTSASFDYEPTEVGTDIFTLTVTDDDGATASDSMNVVVTAAPVANQAPTVSAGVNRMVEVENTIVIVGTALDTDGSITSYEWKKGATVLATSASFEYTPTIVGTDALTFTVIDDDGATASDTMNVLVSSVPVDIVAPVITLIGSNSVDVIQGMAYTDAGAMAIDNVDGGLSASIVVGCTPIGARAVANRPEVAGVVVPCEVDVNAAIGTTFTITYNVKDAAGNAAIEVTRLVNIIADTIAPVLTRNGEQNVDVLQGTTYSDAGATAIDNKDGNLTLSIVIGGDTINTAATINTVFTISYDISDAAGNAAVTQYRYIKIVGGVSHDIPAVSDPDRIAFLNAVNDARAVSRNCGIYGFKPSVQPLTWNTKLYNAAYEYSQDMGMSNTYSPEHLGSGTVHDWTGYALNKQSTFIERIGSYSYSYSSIGENIAAGYTSTSVVVDAWLGSDGHCRNIMNPNFTELGMSHFIKSGTTYTHYWVQEFGRP